MKPALIIIALLLGSVTLPAQKKLFRVMSYNTENLFDHKDDSLTNDSEFLPGGIRGWNYSRYQTKLAHIAQVIVNVGEWNPPALVALCEVENDRCLRDLTRYSGLKNLHYRYIHFESPDPRGIDVALLFQPEMFKPLTERAIRVSHSSHPSVRTRDILYVKGLAPGKDTLHVFVCHFPSRRGTNSESEEKRIFAAGILKSKTDSLLQRNSRANILIMGDFNDYPTDISMHKVLHAQPVSMSVSRDSLYNLMYAMHINGKGSYKHAGSWGALDQILVSGGLLAKNARFGTSQNDVHVYAPDFLLQDDRKYLGKQPFRTYYGMTYQAGYSDHLPVYADFRY